MKRAIALFLVTMALAAVHDPARADEKSPQPLSATVTTAEGEQVAGPIGTLADGKLTLALDPPRSFELADLERIELGKAAAAPGGGPLAWVGQDNHDLVQVGGAPGGNGIQDLHLRADGLAAKTLKQIVIVCRFPKQLRVWRLDTSQSPHWRLAIARSELAPQADLYLEPPADDSFGMKFDVTYTYSDDTTSKSSVTASTHTSDQAKIDRATQPGKPASPQTPSAGGTTEIYLLDQGRLQGDVVALTPESLTLRASWKADALVSILHAKGIWFGKSAPSGARAEFDKQLAAPVADDVVLLVAPDNTTAQVSGNILSLDGERLQLRFEGEERSIKRDRLLGAVFAAHPRIVPSGKTFQTFVLANGETVSGQWQGFGDGALEIETPWQARWRVPADNVAEIRIRNGKLVYLPDLEPAVVEEVPYFGRVIPWGRDRGFDGNAPAMKGKKPVRALAMHSRCVLTFALDEQFATFKATLGFDDSALGRGRVACRVSADGRELFAKNDLRADQDPLPIDVAVAGAKQLTLEVDFGEHEDVGDRVLWAEPRLFRSKPQ